LERSTERTGFIRRRSLRLKLFGRFNVIFRCFKLSARKLQTLSPKFL